MKEIFLASYDEGWSFALYNCYESGDPDVLDDLLRSLCPLVRRVYVKSINNNEAIRGDQNTLEAEGLNEVYRIVGGKHAPISHPGAFTRYLSTSIFRVFHDSIRDLKSQVFNYGKAARIAPPEQIPAQQLVEARIYMQQIRNNVRKAAREMIRFSGAEREVCKLVIDCILGYQTLDPKVIARRRYRLPPRKCNYLIRYTRIIIKAVIYEQRECEREGDFYSLIWPASRGVLCSSGEFW